MKTSEIVKSAGRILDQSAHLSLGFRAAAYQPNTAPTSYGGALAELEAAFSEPEGALAEAASGKLPVLFEAFSRQDVLRAVDFARRHELKGAINLQVHDGFDVFVQLGRRGKSGPYTTVIGTSTVLQRTQTVDRPAFGILPRRAPGSFPKTRTRNLQ